MNNIDDMHISKMTSILANVEFKNGQKGTIKLNKAGYEMPDFQEACREFCSAIRATRVPRFGELLRKFRSSFSDITDEDSPWWKYARAASLYPHFLGGDKSVKEEFDIAMSLIEAVQNLQRLLDNAVGESHELWETQVDGTWLGDKHL